MVCRMLLPVVGWGDTSDSGSIIRAARVVNSGWRALDAILVVKDCGRASGNVYLRRRRGDSRMGTVLDDQGLQAAGRALESARLAAGRTLDQVAASLGVRLPYLEALESGEFSRILGPTYAESMIVRYAVYLGLNPESLLSTATTPLTEIPPQPDGAKPSSEIPARAVAAQSATELPAPSAPRSRPRRSRPRRSRPHVRHQSRRSRLR